MQPMPCSPASPGTATRNLGAGAPVGRSFTADIRFERWRRQAVEKCRASAEARAARTPEQKAADRAELTAYIREHKPGRLAFGVGSTALGFRGIFKTMQGLPGPGHRRGIAATVAR